MVDERDEKKEAYGRIRGMLRAGASRDMAEHVPQYHDRPETDKEDAQVSNLVMPDHDVGDVPDQSRADHGAHEAQPSGKESTRGPRASEHASPSRRSEHADSPPESQKPGDSGPGWAESDHADADPSRHHLPPGPSEVRAREDGKSRSAYPAGKGPPTGHTNPASPTEQQKPGNSGPGWRESDSGRGPSELRARADGATRSAEGDDGDESPTAGLVAGLVHVAKKYRAP